MTDRSEAFLANHSEAFLANHSEAFLASPSLRQGVYSPHSLGLSPECDSHSTPDSIFYVNQRTPPLLPTTPPPHLPTMPPPPPLPPRSQRSSARSIPLPPSSSSSSAAATSSRRKRVSRPEPLYACDDVVLTKCTPLKDRQLVDPERGTPNNVGAPSKSTEDFWMQFCKSGKLGEIAYDVMMVDFSK